MHFNKKVIQRAMPIYIGYLFLGLACGILGQQAHIAPIEAFVMSILAYSVPVFHSGYQFYGEPAVHVLFHSHVPAY